MIIAFAERNRDIKVDIVEYICLDDSDGEISNSPPDSDQDQQEDPRNCDYHDGNEASPDEEGNVDDGQDRSFNSQAGGPHDSTAADGRCGDSSAAGASTESDGIGDFDSSDEETGSEWDHEDSTNS